MHGKLALASIALLTGCTLATAQQPNQIDLKIDSANRTIAVSDEDSISVDPDLAILHIGFETRPSDAKSAYADGAKTSNAIIEAIKQAGIPESSIHSEWQRLEPVDLKVHKFKLEQEWTVKVPTGRAGEILDLAATAGANNCGDIDWTVQDSRALDDKALEKAATHARADAEVLAKANGAKLGALLYITKSISESSPYPMRAREMLAENSRAPAAAPPLAIAPNKVVSSAAVYAIYAIESLPAQ
jgi:hypothetical protein